MSSRVKLFLEEGMASKRPAGSNPEGPVSLVEANLYAQDFSNGETLVAHLAPGGQFSAFRVESPFRDVWKLSPGRYGAPTTATRKFAPVGEDTAGTMQHFQHGSMYARPGWGCWFEDSRWARRSIEYGTWPREVSGKGAIPALLASAECAEAKRLITARLEADGPAGRVGKPRDPVLTLCEVLPGGRTAELDGSAVPWGRETLIAVPHLQRAVRLILGFRNTWAQQPYLYGLPLEDEHEHAEGGTAQAYQRGLMRWAAGHGQWWTPNGLPGAFGQADARSLAAVAWRRDELLSSLACCGQNQPEHAVRRTERNRLTRER